MVGDVFISYSWDNEEHEQKVLEFTNHLRKNGYDAIMDKMISQQETTTNFVKMMHQAILEHKKIIIVLSEGYKVKAETFSGGVGEEYKLILNDISNNPTKYILISFNGRSDKIIPIGFKGNDVVDLSQSNGLGFEALYRKLSGIQKYIFADVAAEKPKLDSIEIGDFISTNNLKFTNDDTSNIKKQRNLTLLNNSEKIDLAYKVVKEYYDGKKSNYKTIKRKDCEETLQQNGWSESESRLIFQPITNLIEGRGFTLFGSTQKVVILEGIIKHILLDYKEDGLKNVITSLEETIKSGHGSDAMKGLLNKLRKGL